MFTLSSEIKVNLFWISSLTIKPKVGGGGGGAPRVFVRLSPNLVTSPRILLQLLLLFDSIITIISHPVAMATIKQKACFQGLAILQSLV